MGGGSDGGELLQQRGGESDTAAEETVVAGFLRELAREFGLEVDVLGPDRANRDRGRDADRPGRDQGRGIGRGKTPPQGVRTAPVPLQPPAPPPRSASST